MSNTIEKQGIRNYNSSVVVSDSEVSVLREEEDAAFYPLVYFVLVIYGVS